ncbi:MAG: RnfABCDGE type electron transport complex subunit D [Sphaerochaetaceae bacterium]
MNLRMSTAPHIKSSDTTSSLMRNVIIALIPCTMASIYFFGLNAIILILVSIASAVLSEFIFEKLSHKKVTINDGSAFLTGLLLALNIPSSAPWWIALIGSAFAIIIVKQLFGGLGGNFINPALGARGMLVVSWASIMTTFTTPTGFAAADAVTSATPLATNSADYTTLLFGNIPGTMGETSKIMILLGLAFLLITRTIKWRIPVVTLASTAFFSFIFGSDPLYAVLAGGIMFGAVFMATDYVTSPMTAAGQYIYSVGIGLLVVIIRVFGNYPEGVTFAIILMNVVTGLIDKYCRERVYGHSKGEKHE